MTLERMPFGDVIRQAIRDSSKTIYQLAIESGCDQSNIRAFMAGKRGLSVAALERLCDILELELKPKRDD